MNTDSKPHILAIPLPAQGHLNSLLRLCNLLASQSLTITFLNLENVHRRLEQQQTSPQNDPSGSVVGIRMAFLPNTGFDLSEGFGHNLSEMIDAIEKSADPLRLFVKQLLEEGPSLTCIIADVTTSTWTHEVAHEFNIPWFAFFPFSQCFCLFWIHAPLLISEDLIPIEAGFSNNKEPLRTNLPGLPPLLLSDLPAFKHVEDETQYMYRWMIRNFQQLYKAEGILANTFYELEDHAIDVMQAQGFSVYSVGPMVNDQNASPMTSLWIEEEHCLHWLNGQPLHSVLYIAFGSITLVSLAQFEEIVLGLEASKQQFLWVFRPDLVDNLNYDAIEYIKARTRGSGYIVSWSPQLTVLENPAVGGFLTHCGWNSALESMSKGVPMICWPYFADQTMNCGMIVREWKVGIEMERGEGGIVTRDEVERKVRCVMNGDEGKEMRQKAAKLKEVAVATRREGGSSYENLRAFVHKVEMMVSGEEKR